MTEVYSRELQETVVEEASVLGIEVRRGIYAALSGPSYETPAEIHMLRSFGADAIGMSTVPEAIVARHMGMNVLGISCITNMAAGISDGPINHEEVMEMGNEWVRLLLNCCADHLRRAAAIRDTGSRDLVSSSFRHREICL